MLRRRVALPTLMIGALLAQTAFFPHVRIFGVVPDVMLLTVVAVAASEGPERGAVFGFVAGLLLDLFLEVPAGLSALCYTLVGYGVGVAQATFLRSQWWLVPVLGGTASLSGGLLFALAGIVVGEEYLLDARTFVVIGERAFYDALLALVVLPVAARIMGPQPRVTSYRPVGELK